MDHFLRSDERFGHDAAVGEPGFVGALFDELLDGEAGGAHDDELRFDLSVTHVDRIERTLVGFLDEKRVGIAFPD